MTPEEKIKVAKREDLLRLMKGHDFYYDNGASYSATIWTLQKFVDRIKKEERERCAKVCDNLEHTDPEYYQFEMPTSNECADAIRSLGDL